MTKMTKTVAAAVALLLAAGTATIAANAASDTSSTITPTSTPTPTASESLSPLNGDATLEDVESNGPPKGGTISTDDPDLDEGYMDPNEPILPTAELSGYLDGRTFKGTVAIDATASNVELSQFQVCLTLSVLLESGETKPLTDCPYQLTQLGITEGTETVGVAINFEDFYNAWNQPGHAALGGVIDSVSPVIKFSLHPSYEDPQFGTTGFKGNSINLTLSN